MIWPVHKISAKSSVRTKLVQTEPEICSAARGLTEEEGYWLWHLRDEKKRPCSIVLLIFVSALQLPAVLSLPWWPLQSAIRVFSGHVLWCHHMPWHHHAPFLGSSERNRVRWFRFGHPYWLYLILIYIGYESKKKIHKENLVISKVTHFSWYPDRFQ